jgi:glyoxylase-like metal-dependent hydrolase (beta-lactamase superfamily II)
VTKVVETATAGQPIPVGVLFEGGTPDMLEGLPWLKPHFADNEGRLMMSIHAFVIDTGKRRIVVDTCVGNNKKRHMPVYSDLQGTFLEDLKAAGYPADSIDTVICTHLHFDHVGWNTRLEDGKWVPTFPKAQYLFSQKEMDHWNNGGAITKWGDMMGDSIRPVFDAGLARLVDMNHRLGDEVVLDPTPGHTPGHVSVRILSRGEEAVITGDMMHHPVQIGIPTLGIHVDNDKQAAIQTRLAFLARHADKPVLVLGTHFAGPSAGWIKKDGDTWRLALA